MVHNSHCPKVINTTWQNNNNNNIWLTWLFEVMETLQACLFKKKKTELTFESKSTINLMFIVINEPLLLLVDYSYYYN